MKHKILFRYGLIYFGLLITVIIAAWLIIAVFFLNERTSNAEEQFIYFLYSLIILIIVSGAYLSFKNTKKYPKTFWWWPLLFSAINLISWLIYSLIVSYNLGDFDLSELSYTSFFVVLIFIVPFFLGSANAWVPDKKIKKRRKLSD